MSPASFKKCYHENVFINHIYSIYMYTKDLALNNQLWLIGNENQLTNQQTNQTINLKNN